ncbi:MAG: ferritin-like protein [Planctomycetota bacterium]|nr:ferritin-like protein [Planctomycetota bacterium]
MKLRSLSDLFIVELSDLMSAENQLIKALPKMAKGASSPDLRKAFEDHLEQTKGHVQRLQTIFEELGESPKRKKCKAMEGLIEEGEEMLGENAEPAVKDAGLIGAAQRVEHYEIAAYGTAATYARHLGDTVAEQLLRQTLAEEGETDKLLTSIAESSINFRAEVPV